jgi:hypothetical protein
MARRTRALSASILALIVVGSVGFLNLTQRPRFQALHTVDVLQLLATGMCYGVALTQVIALLRKPRAG